MKTPQKPKKYEDRLMDAFAFDEDDLDANEAGHLSPYQIERLKAARNTALALFALMWLLCGILAAIIVVLGIKASGLLPPVIAGLLLSAGVSFVFSTSRKLIADLREKRILAAEGRVELSMLGDSDYSILIEEQRFRLNKRETFLTFKNGDPYRIYYTPRSRRILSVEWLRENDDNLLDAGESQADSNVDTDSGATLDQRTQARPR